MGRPSAYVNSHQRAVSRHNFRGWGSLPQGILRVELDIDLEKFRYNSAVFQSFDSFDYTIGVVKNSFLDGAPFDVDRAQQRSSGDWSFTDDNRINPPDDYERVFEDIRTAALNETSPYTRYNVSACFDYYDGYFTPEGNGLIFVKNESVQLPADDSLLIWVSVIPRTDDWAKNLWAISNGSFPVIGHLQSPAKPVNRWFVGKPHYEVDYCLLQRVPWTEQKCRLQYAPWILAIVCIFNMVKLLTISGIWFTSRRARRRREHAPLATIGDAIQSFMQFPDPETRGMCLSTWRDFQKPLWVPWRRARRDPAYKKGLREPQLWVERSHRWWSSVGPRNWIAFILM